MTTLKLSIRHRIQFTALLNTFKGSYSELTDVLKLVEKVRLNIADTEKYGIKVADDQISWDPKKDEAVDIQLTDDEKKIAYNMLKKLDDDKQFTLDSRPLVDIYEQLK